MGAFLPVMWRDLGAAPDALDAVVDAGPAVQALLPSPLPVGALAADAVAVASLLASQAVTGRWPTRLRLSPERVATAYSSERHYRLDGQPMSVWAPLSGFWECADGWLRTHGNYPWHRSRLLAALELSDAAGPQELRARLGELPTGEAEVAIVAAGGVAAAVRSADEWAVSEPARSVAAEPLLRRELLGDGIPVRAPEPGRLRVLDLTRVIAGPVATRTLALLGADVLRLDPPGLPEPPGQHLDTGMGKRSALLDVADPTGRARFDELLASADVVVTGYRPGSLERLGLAAAALAEHRPGIVVARLSAWGATGPWGARRGFDSIVQAATGIAERSGSGGRPGALPAQALDHTAGYLLAAGVLSALRSRAETGGSWLVETSLARIAAELLAAPAPAAGEARTLEPTVRARESESGELSYAVPAPAGPGIPDDWSTVGRSWGTDPAQWR
ncbi:MAG: L-carnitine dehydratase/bile acid-inducible protein [Naasia sp.]|nr:L-carnitine dehydratase/bile acid-inducible protein [Naasia sp.]